MAKIITVVLPDIGEGVVEGEVIEWLKKEGEPLQQDEPVVVVMTDKATVELPAPHPGILHKQYYQPGQIAIKDKPLYDIEVERNEEKEKKVSPTSPSSPLSKPIKQPSQPPLSREEPSQVRAAPSTRKLANEVGINLSAIKGSGTEGLITNEDIKLSVCNNRESERIKHPLLHLSDDEEKPLLGIRKLMAKKMAASHHFIPHFSYFESLDATRLVQMRQYYKEKGLESKTSVTYMPFIMRALSLTLKEFPLANSSFDEERQLLLFHKQQHIGFATSTKQGLIVPVLKNVEKMNLQELIHGYETLKEKATHNQLHPDDLKEGTITISNFGVLGNGLWATPIINIPEVAILAVSRIHKQPWVQNGELVVRDILNVSWSFDHRVIDGEEAAAISTHFCKLLQNPAGLQ